MGSKYKIYVNKDKKHVIAVGKFCGKYVRARAKCSPEDTFDEKKGAEIAEARCRVKITEMIASAASRRLLEAVTNKQKLEEEINVISKQVSKAIAESEEAKKQLKEIEKYL